MPAITRPFRWLGAAVGLALCPSLAAAEVELPRRSPTATVSQQVGLTDISVEYASPAVKGRKIWGAVVPYDRSWSISPNQPTRVRFSKEVEIGDKEVPAGTYVLSMIPSKGDWTVVLTRSLNQDSSTDPRSGTDPRPARTRALAPAPPRTRPKATWSGSGFGRGPRDAGSAWRSCSRISATRESRSTSSGTRCGCRSPSW